MPTIRADDKASLQHMTGSDSRYPKADWGYRNYFCSCKTGENFESMKRLESAGFVMQGSSSVNSIYFHATELGLKELGFNKKQMDKAFDRKTLHLHLKYEYFDEIKAGTKTKEYRLADKWKKKLDKRITHLRLYRGYQAASQSTIIDLKFKGYELETITHPHFGSDPVLVCSIDVSS